MSRKRERPSRRGIEPVGVQVRDAGPDALGEFFRFGGPSVYACGCSAHDAVQVSLDDGGTAANLVSNGLDRSDIEEFRQAVGVELLAWWHDCPEPARSELRPRAC